MMRNRKGEFQPGNTSPEFLRLLAIKFDSLLALE
jgi:hypothetical protein